MLIGQIVGRNGVDYLECYPAFTSGNIPSSAEGGVLVNIEWVTPVSDNGMAASSLRSSPGSAPKPGPDSFRVATVQDVTKGGGYVKFAVEDSFTASTYTNATTLNAVTIPVPVFDSVFSVPGVAICPPATKVNVSTMPAFTGTNDTYTATGTLIAPDGTPIVLSPLTSVGKGATLLAAAMTTNWAQETGGGTFVASGDTIIATTPAGTFTYTVAQSDT